jgi:outer membrane immunogenic protein
MESTGIAMIKFVFGALLAASVSVATSALAADLPAKARIVPAAAGFNWTGFYIGAVAGGGIVTPYFVDFTENFSYGNWHNGGAAFTAGGTIGYNWQVGAAVIGVEADFSWVKFDKSSLNNLNGTRFDAKWNWLSTVRGRAGLAVDRALIYVTGGLAIVDLDYRVFRTGGANPGCGPVGDCARLDKTILGLAAGAGAEYAFSNNWSMKFEYLYVRLPTKEINDSFDPNPNLQYQYTTDGHFLRVGLNYRFGGPVVARY